MSIFCIICLDNQSNNTEIHLVADKHQLSQINLEVSHLIDVFQRFGTRRCEKEIIYIMI